MRGLSAPVAAYGGNARDPSRLGFAVAVAHTPNMPYTARVQVPMNLRMAGQTTAEEPRHLTDIMLNYEEAVGATFGVPRSFFGQFSAGRSGNNPDAMIMWQNSQRRLKQTMIQILTSVHRSIYNRAYVKNALISPDADSINMAAVREKVTVRVMLPGVPPNDDLEKWYRMGILKYTAYRAITAKAYGMDEKDFEETPTMSPAELEKVQLRERPGDNAKAASSSGPARKKAKVAPKKDKPKPKAKAKAKTK